MKASRKKILARCAVGCLLLIVTNAYVAVHYLGTPAGQTYRWICNEYGVELIYTPSVFGCARLTPNGTTLNGERSWKLVQPRELSPLFPWNWLALALDPPGPDPESVIRQMETFTRG